MLSEAKSASGGKLGKIVIIVIFAIIVVGIGYFALKKKPTNQLTDLPKMIKVTSAAFSEGEIIPKKYTCDGEDVSPSLTIEGVPSGAKSLVLIIDDPDAPIGTWTHFLAWNILSSATLIIEEGTMPQGAVLGKNDFGKTKYGGPCPPSGTHRYFFKIYALDSALNLAEGTKRKELETALQGHVLDQGELMGKYQRSNKNLLKKPTHQ